MGEPVSIPNKEFDSVTSATKDQSCSRLCALSFPEDEKCAYLFNAHFAPKCIGAPKMDSSQRFTASSFRQGLEKPSRQ